MNFYPDSSESCGCNPGKHLSVYTSQRTSSPCGRGSEYQHPAGLSPRLEQLGSLTIAQDSFVKTLVLSLTRITSEFCTILTGTQQGRKPPFKWC